MACALCASSRTQAVFRTWLGVRRTISWLPALWARPWVAARTIPAPTTGQLSAAAPITRVPISPLPSAAEVATPVVVTRPQLAGEQPILPVAIIRRSVAGREARAAAIAARGPAGGLKTPRGPISPEGGGL